MKRLCKSCRSSRVRFSTLIMYLVGLYSVVIAQTSIASTPKLSINCQFPTSVEEEGIVSGTILINVVNVSGITLENILFSLAEPSSGFIHGEIRESFLLMPGDIQVISGSFNMDTKQLPESGNLSWRVHYSDGVEHDEFVSSNMCTG